MNTIPTFEDILRDSRPCDLVDQVLAELRRERDRTILDPVLVKINRDWSRLGHQVVGAETF